MTGKSGLSKWFGLTNILRKNNGFGEKSLNQLAYQNSVNIQEMNWGESH